MDDDATSIVEFPAPEHSVSHRKVPWALIATALIAVAVLVGAGLLAAPGITVGRLVEGTASANPQGVIQAAQERKNAEEAAAAQKKKADDAAFLASLESQVRDSMQEYFDGPDNDLGHTIEIYEVHLIKTGDTKFEGMAAMSADYGSRHNIPIHVTADERNLMWETDPGGLLPLFR